MSMETYKEKLAKAELYEQLAEAENQMKNGEKLLDAAEVFDSLRDRYGNKQVIIMRVLYGKQKYENLL